MIHPNRSSVDITRFVVDRCGRKKIALELRFTSSLALDPAKQQHELSTTNAGCTLGQRRCSGTISSGTYGRMNMNSSFSLANCDQLAIARAIGSD